MAKKLFVGGLSWSTDDVSLRRAFERFGEVVEAKVITDRDTGRSRGFGFVSYTEGESGSNAMSEMDGVELDGRTIRVNEAQDKGRGGGGGRRDFRGGGGGGGGGGYRGGGGDRGGRGGGGGGRW